MSLFPESKLHTLLKTRLDTLKSELERLSVRQMAVTRLRHAAILHKNAEGIEDEEDEAVDALIASIDAVDFDLAIFSGQLHDRQKHLSKGIALLNASSVDSFRELLTEHFIDEANLAISDAKVAREGYDELIADLQILTVQPN